VEANVKSYFLSSAVALSLVGALVAACGDSGETGGSGGTGASEGGNGGSGATGGTPGPGPTVGGMGGMGGAPGDGNDSFAEAIELTVGEGLLGEFDPAATDVDFYSFNGSAGDAVLIQTDAKSGILGVGPGTDPFIEGYADLVVELYDEAEQLIATNDDPIPRNTQDSRLVTILPATGKYYLKVSEFCLSWDQGPMGRDCYSDLDESGEYGIAVSVLNPADNSNIEEVEGANPTPWEYEPNTDAGAGLYFASVGWGNFSAAADSDPFSFNTPDDVDLEVGTPALFTGRLNATFDFFPSGTTGNGSAADPGVVRVINATTMAVVAELDVAAVMDPTFGATIDVPVDAATDYVLEFNGEPGSTFGDGYFYFTWGSIGPANPVENDPMFALGGAGNETLVDADGMYEQANTDMDMSTSWFIEGDIDSATDVDFYLVPVTGDPLLSAFCSGINSGSGLTVTASLVDDTGALLPGATATETLNQMGFLANVAAPATGDVYLKIERGAQSPTVTGTYYRCGVSNYTTPIAN
jgi:hypothetical protein